MAVQSMRAPGAAGLDPPGAGRPPRVPAPLWRSAPGRLLHDPLTLLLMGVVLTLVAVSASAGPLYAEAVSDASVRLVLDTVPRGESANAAPVVRLSGGVDPVAGEWSALVRSVGTVPGLDPARVTSQTISGELHPRFYYDPVGPVVTGPRGRAPVRFFGMQDPASRLVVVSRMPGTASGVWLPAPLAAATGSTAGDEVRVQVSGLPKMPRVRTRVVGVYAVAADGRTPRDAPGQRWWADVVAAGFPTDTERPTLRASLAVADLATTAELARRSKDQLLWSAESRLDPPTPRLAQLRRTATAVGGLRRNLAARAELADGPVALRLGLASGLEDLSARADEVAAAAQRGAAVTSRTGIVLGLALVVAAAVFSMGRRRREVQLGAGVGRGPASAGLLHVAELVLPALVAGVLGWLAARALVGAAVGSGTPSSPALVDAALWCAGALLVALALSGAVAAAANRVETRRLEGRAPVRVPWLAVLVALTASATVGLVTRPRSGADPLGPLDLLVPPLLIACLAALGCRAVFVAARRLGRRTRTRHPTRRGLSWWLARRRLQSPDVAREAATTIAATGLAMLVLSVASLASVEDVVDDRAAVEVGAQSVHRLGSSWHVDPTAPTQAPQPPDGTPLPPAATPAGRNPALPPGQSVVWRTQTTVAASSASVHLMVIDPARLPGSADWGSAGGPVGLGRAMLPALAAQDAAAAATIRRNGVPSEVPGLLVGSLEDLDLEVGSTLTVDTLGNPVRVVVRGVLDAFPGARTGRPTLVLAADSFFANQFNDDPRLRPAPGVRRNQPIEFQADLWSRSAAAAVATLTRFEVPVEPVASLAQARTVPVYVAAAQARRYQVALGAVFGLLGLAAVVLAGVRLARRAPAADLMVAWTGAGSRAPARARALEVAAVLVLTCVLSVAGLLALRPLASTLLEPGDGRTPPATLTVPAAAWALGLAWVAAAALATLLGMRWAATSQSAVEVLRGEE